MEEGMGRAQRRETEGGKHMQNFFAGARKWAQKAVGRRSMGKRSQTPARPQATPCPSSHNLTTCAPPLHAQPPVPDPTHPPTHLHAQLLRQLAHRARRSLQHALVIAWGHRCGTQRVQELLLGGAVVCAGLAAQGAHELRGRTRVCKQKGARARVRLHWGVCAHMNARACEGMCVRWDACVYVHMRAAAACRAGASGEGGGAHQASTACWVARQAGRQVGRRVSGHTP